MTYTSEISTGATIYIEYDIDGGDVWATKVYGFNKSGQRVELSNEVLEAAGIADEIDYTIREVIPNEKPERELEW